MPGQVADAGLEGDAVVQHQGGGLVLVGGDIAQFSAVPVDANGVGVVGVLGFPAEFQAVAHGEVLGQGVCLVVLEAGQGAGLDEVVPGGAGGGGQGGQSEQAGQAGEEVAADHGNLRVDGVVSVLRRAGLKN